MPRHLVIVESPAKAKTLGRQLGRDFLVRASLGHVRDLPRNRLAVDLARGFAPEYEILATRRRVVSELRAAAREAETISLAADPDREGEAICWHLAEALAGPRRRFQRVAFHELTRRAVEQAFRAPREIDARRVDAQQARRILDRLVGYHLSPLLWRKLGGGLSAGRVQSVALRIVCERERAILGFVPEEHWTIRAWLDSGTPPVFAATLVAVDEAQALVRSAGEAGSVVHALEAASFRVATVVERSRQRAPAPPFTTSTLQQEAFRKLRFGVKKTMQIAQRLYEGSELGDEGAVGLITYMRTDSTRVAPEAASAAGAYVERVFGPAYRPPTPNVFASSRGAQEAHEAIRPSDLARTPEALRALLGRDELALYTLVFERFVASQMASAVYHDTHVEIEARPPETAGGTAVCRLRARGGVLRFRGFLALYEESAADDAAPRAGGSSGSPAAGRPGAEASGPLPPLRGGQQLTLAKVDSQQRFTEPEARFSEAGLVKELERCGIGRPSTYASILATLLDRHYVTRTKARLQPTPLGFAATDLLVERFPELMSVGYTAAMEQDLDAIEEGRATLLGTLRDFWARFSGALDAARGEHAAPAAAPAHSLEGSAALGDCPACASPLVRRQGRYGPFVGCSRYPRCRHVQQRAGRADVQSEIEAGTAVGADAAPVAGLSCPRCHEGRVVERRSGDRAFFGCSRFPGCRFTSSRRPLAESCPECGAVCLFEKETKRDGHVVFCGNEACHFHRCG